MYYDAISRLVGCIGRKKWKVGCVGHGFKWLKQASKTTQVCDTLPYSNHTHLKEAMQGHLYYETQKRQQFKKRKGDSGSEISKPES